MILSGHQPSYLPAIGLMNKIALSDIYMHCGHCQMKPGTSHNHTYLGGAKQTIPVKNNFGQSINDTEFAGPNWKRKHLRTIYLAYGKAPHFERYFDDFKLLIEQPWERLGPMNMAIIEWLCLRLRIDTEIVDSRDFDIGDHEDPTDMLVDMCEAVGADHYLSNRNSKYVNENKLATHGITHVWQDYQGKHGEASVLELLFNHGPEAGNMVRARGRIG